jgi:hypothetical protein
MKIAFVTELGHSGKFPSSFENARTEVAWMIALDADNVPILDIQNVPDNSYDVAIIIIPKKLENFMHIPITENLSRIARKTAFMQEGPSWYYHDLPLKYSFATLNIMSNVDFVLCHNECDKIYYEGLLDKDTFVNPTLMIEETIKNLPTVSRSGTMVGGNFCRWYGGFDSLVIANYFDTNVFLPSMGRMTSEEKNMSDDDKKQLNFQHIPYMSWTNWIKNLNQYKYAVHLMPTVAAGTFSLNCAFLGIPCIGNEKIDTQRLCFPDISVDVSDTIKAGAYARLLKDEQFYNEISEKAKVNYKTHFELDVYRKRMEDVLKKCCER